MFTEHLATFRVILLFDAAFDVVCIDGFVHFADGSFPSIGQMLVDNINVSSRFVSLDINGLCFHDAEVIMLSMRGRGCSDALATDWSSSR